MGSFPSEPSTSPYIRASENSNGHTGLWFRQPSALPARVRPFECQYRTICALRLLQCAFRYTLAHRLAPGIADTRLSEAIRFRYGLETYWTASHTAIRKGTYCQRLQA